MKRISLLRWVLWFNTNKLNLINSPNEVSKHALVPQYFCPETGDLGEVSVDFDFSKAKSVINTIDNTRKTNVATANIMIQQTGLPRRSLLNSTVSSSNRFILLWILWQSGCTTQCLKQYYWITYLFCNLDSDLDLSATARRHAIVSSNATVWITGHHMTLLNDGRILKNSQIVRLNRVSLLSGCL